MRKFIEQIGKKRSGSAPRQKEAPDAVTASLQRDCYAKKTDHRTRTKHPVLDRRAYRRNCKFWQTTLSATDSGNSLHCQKYLYVTAPMN
jgi:hypothetical protein